jgi:hypothetical protein
MTSKWVSIDARQCSESCDKLHTDDVLMKFRIKHYVVTIIMLRSKMEVLWIWEWCFHLSAYYCIACQHHMAFVSKSKALITSVLVEVDISTASVYINRIARHLAESMWTYTERGFNGLTKMWMGSFHEKFFFLPRYERHHGNGYCHVCFCDFFGKEINLSITVLMFTYCSSAFFLILSHFPMWIVERQFI